MIDHTKNINDLLTKGFVVGNIEKKISFANKLSTELYDMYDTIDKGYQEEEKNDLCCRFKDLNPQELLVKKTYDLMDFFEKKYIAPLFDDNFERIRIGHWRRHAIEAEEFHNDRKLWNGKLHNSSIFIYIDDHHTTFGNFLEIKNTKTSDIHRIYLEKGTFVWLNQAEHFLHRGSKQKLDAPKNSEGFFIKRMITLDYEIKAFE